MWSLEKTPGQDGFDQTLLLAQIDGRWIPWLINQGNSWTWPAPFRSDTRQPVALVEKHVFLGGNNLGGARWGQITAD